MRHVATLILSCAVILGAVAYVKLSSEALAVLAGGILAAVILIPAFVLVIVIARRSQPAPAPPREPRQQPTVIVVGGQPQLPQQQPEPWVDGTWRQAAPERSFRILGED